MMSVPIKINLKKKKIIKNLNKLMIEIKNLMMKKNKSKKKKK